MMTWPAPPPLISPHTDSHVKLFVHGFDANFRKYVHYGSEHLIKNTDIFLMMKEILDEGN